jgi:hypothetical protein
MLFANEITVRSNIESGTYDFALEVYLLSNDKNAKIFYYTDGIGRFDTLKEFSPQSPLIIKKDTTLNFYAINDMNNSTKIAETQYRFTYPENIDISYKDEKIILTNTTNTIVNIGYFKIESNLLNYEIYKNTFLNPKETFTLKYTPKSKDTLKLIAPNGKEITNFEIIPAPMEKILPSSEITQIEENISQETSPLPSEETLNIPEKIETQAPIAEPTLLPTETLKASASETKSSSKDIYILLYGFVAFLFVMTCYNIFTLIQTHKKTKNKNKKL